MLRTTTTLLPRGQARTVLTTLRLLMLALLLGVVLVACGDDGDDGEDATSEGTVTPISIVSGDPPHSSPVPASPAASPTTRDPATVGELASRVASAWSNVTSYRATSTDSGSGGVLVDALASPAVSSPIASPAAISDDGSVAVDEILMPDRRHQTVREAGTESEFVAISGTVYVRGAYARVYIDPTIDPATWVRLDSAQFAPDSPVGIFIERFAGPAAFASPFANLQASTLALPLVPFDQSIVDGRTCRSYTVVRTTQTGERVDITLAIDEQDLPCYQETRAGGIVSRTTFGDFNADISIEPPTGAEAISAPSPGAAGSPSASPEVE